MKGVIATLKWAVDSVSSREKNKVPKLCKAQYVPLKINLFESIKNAISVFVPIEKKNSYRERESLLP